MKMSFVLLAFVATSLFAFVTPAFAYEEDTHFQMTYVICRSVGFTPSEAMIIAAVDQGMDDSPGTVANGDFGPIPGVIPNVDEEAFWHALDGYGYKDGGTMKVSGILSRRDQLYQQALNETTVRNKLIRFGVFFHYQEDTWGHRHHYKTAGEGLRVIPTYDPDHLSRNSYISYNTPTGHAPDAHAPDRPPFDPVAALMDLEDGIVYARRFLKEGLGREPGAFLANYTPQGGQDDANWKGGNSGAFFHQISLVGAAPNSARSYLLSLIRAQIDAYSTSFTVDPRYFPYSTPDEANLDRMRAALNKVCKDFELYRGAGIYRPAINIPTTAQKVAQGFTGLTTKQLAAEKLPDNWHYLVGVGFDGYLWTKATLSSDWIKIPDSGKVKGITLMPDRTILAADWDGNLWTRKTLTSPWVSVPNSGFVRSVVVMPDGTLLGTGVDFDNHLWTKATLTADWKQVPNSDGVIAITLMPDGTILGVRTDYSLWTRATIFADWVKTPNVGGQVIAVTILEDGTILGVGKDYYLWTRKTLNDKWVQVPHSESVVAVIEMPLAN